MEHAAHVAETMHMAYVWTVLVGSGGQSHGCDEGGGDADPTVQNSAPTTQQVIV